MLSCGFWIPKSWMRFHCLVDRVWTPVAEFASCQSCTVYKEGMVNSRGSSAIDFWSYSTLTIPATSGIGVSAACNARQTGWRCVQLSRDSWRQQRLRYLLASSASQVGKTMMSWSTKWWVWDRKSCLYYIYIHIIYIYIYILYIYTYYIYTHILYIYILYIYIYYMF